MTIRLNAMDRGTILKRVLEHAFRERTEKLNQERKEVGKLVYDSMYSKDVQAKMAALGANFFRASNRVEIQIEGERNTTTVELGEYFPLSYEHAYVAGVTYPRTSPLALRIFQILEMARRIQADRDTKKAQVRAVLYAVHTIKALLKIWPEVGAFVTDFKETTPEGGAIVRDLRKLNSELGLPPTSTKKKS